MSLAFYVYKPQSIRLDKSFGRAIPLKICMMFAVMDLIEQGPAPIESLRQLNLLDTFVVAKLSQAIINEKAVNIIYTSLSNGRASASFYCR